MKKSLLFIIGIIVWTLPVIAQTITHYEISFNNAVHHEADISVLYTNLDEKPLQIRMSRTSPGRYALHEFAKNVYNVRAFDSNGNQLPVTRPNPHQWDVAAHDGTVRFEYTLFANHGDGTYAQVDESHAHLNMPATFAWARGYAHRPIHVTFHVREDLNWKVATQLKHIKDNTYYAPNLDYFLDSPTEIADFVLHEEIVDGQNIRMAMHTHASELEIADYFTKVMAIVHAQRDIFGELPAFDFGEYTFLTCYVPNASGDGMEHRNSTYVTSSKPVDRPLGETGISTIAHEFFHIWNVERIRPASLEPFNFEEANMSGELWFAEGFTSYYTGLTLARAGIRTTEEYIRGLAGAINTVLHSPGRHYFNPIEMSYQAPFVDAARSVDPQNRENTFVSYYTYGSVLGLALDLKLRSLPGTKNLDDFFKLMWVEFGKNEIPYTVRDIQSVLAKYTDDQFAAIFFENYIFNSQLPDLAALLSGFGVSLELARPETASLGTSISIQNGVGRLRTNAIKGSPVYDAGITSGDLIQSIGGVSLSEVNRVEDILADKKPGDIVEIQFIRWGQQRSAKATLAKDPTLTVGLSSNATADQIRKRNQWVSGH